MNPEVLSSARTIKDLTITIRRAVRHDKVVYLTEQLSLLLSPESLPGTSKDWIHMD